MLGKAASGCLVFIVLLIVSVIVIYWVGFPKVSYKYRLTVVWSRTVVSIRDRV